MKKHLISSSMIAVSAAFCANAYAEFEPIIVTATKRAENAQDIPVALQAIDATSLEELNVNNFTDYLQQLPNVSAGGSGPGQNTIYIRGLASTTPNLTTAGVAGLAPNVALYLDEQPLSQPGRNLDIYAADLERIEVLSGPQGTLFGASSQAGTIRLITKKPNLETLEIIGRAGVSTTEGGKFSQKFEAVLNVPVNDKLALRGVVYVDNQGGYIDNVAGTRDASESARFRTAGTVRANGTIVSSNRAGFQAGADLSDVTFLSANNSALVEEDFNDTQYRGMRLSGLYEINDDWSLNISHARQSLDSDGVFFTDPDLGDYEIQRYADDSIEDEFSNTSWTLEGRIGKLEALYTGAFTDRDTDQLVDYSDYLFVGQYLPYYICDGSVSYPGSAAPSGTCQPPTMFVDSKTNLQVATHELRINTPVENRLRATTGIFYSDLELTELNDFTYPGSVDATLFGQIGFSTNSPFMTGYRSNAGPFPAGVIFRNDIKRTDKQLGLFGEVNYDLTDELVLTLGTRYYDIEIDFEGSANSSFCNGFQADANAFGTDISDLYNGDGQYTFRGTCDTSRHITYTQGQSIADIQATDPELSLAQATQIFNALNAPDKASTDGFIFKGNLSWTPMDGILLYTTYSEGFRPGFLNRPGGAQGPNGFTVPFALDTDDVTNYEFGWKSSLMDNQLQLNGNVFFVDIERLQTTIFDTSIVNLFFSDNAANAKITGLESDFIFAPKSVEGLTITGAVSLLDTEITEVLTPTDDVVDGSDLAFAPDIQANLRARYEWEWRNQTAHFMGQFAYTGSSRSDIIEINSAPNDSYTTFGLSAGVTNDVWSMELFATNLGNTKGEIANTFVYDRERINLIQPRTIGIRLSVNY